MAFEDIDKQSPEVAAMAKHWAMLAALCGGTAAMRDAGEQFMPRWPKEEKDSFSARLKTATLFPSYSRTCSIMAAKPFARPLDIDEEKLPVEIKGFLSDVDMFGTDFHPYLAGLFLSAMQSGLVGVLVDCQPAGKVKTLSDEKKAGIRPYFATYLASSILGFRTNRNSNGVTLTQLRLMESISEPDNQFADKIIPQIRVLTPGRWETYRLKQNVNLGKKEWVLYESGTTSLDRIPFVFFYGIRDGFGIGQPPLLDLAFLNVEHWQSSSDQQTILHVARIPVLFAKGFGDGDSIVIGAATAATATNKDADLRYVEHTGAAVEAGRVSILDLEDRMRQTGAELLVKRPSRNTATEVRAEGAGNKSALQKIVEDFEESAEECLDLMGLWIKKTVDAEIKLFKDFDTGNLSELNGDLLLRAAADGIISRETAFIELKRLDVIHSEAQWDIEIARLKADPPPIKDPGPLKGLHR